jgi:hypothetical protein
MRATGRARVKTCTDEKLVESFSCAGLSLNPFGRLIGPNKPFEKKRSNTTKHSRRGLSLRRLGKENKILKAFFAPTFTQGLGRKPPFKKSELKAENPSGADAADRFQLSGYPARDRGANVRP